MHRVMSAIATCLSLSAFSGSWNESASYSSWDDRSNSYFQCDFLLDAYPPLYYPPAVHWLLGVSALGDSLELEDGAVWKISSYDGWKALRWGANDPLVITQNHSWFSHYTYRIMNRSTGEHIEANLFLGPMQRGEHTVYIEALDIVDGFVSLFSGKGERTQWEVAPADSDVLRTWAVQDAVIIGQNSGWDARCDSILINVNMNRYVRARQR